HRREEQVAHRDAVPLARDEVERATGDVAGGEQARERLGDVVDGNEVQTGLRVGRYPAKSPASHAAERENQAAERDAAPAARVADDDARPKDRDRQPPRRRVDESLRLGLAALVGVAMAALRRRVALFDEAR